MSKATLSRYILMGKVPAPPETLVGGMRVRLWEESDIKHLQEALPKAKNGRKTRHQKLKGIGKAQPRAAVPHKTRKPRKK